MKKCIDNEFGQSIEYSNVDLCYLTTCLYKPDILDV